MAARKPVPPQLKPNKDEDAAAFEKRMKARDPKFDMDEWARLYGTELRRVLPDHIIWRDVTVPLGPDPELAKTKGKGGGGGRPLASSTTLGSGEEAEKDPDDSN